MSSPYERSPGYYTRDRPAMSSPSSSSTRHPHHSPSSRVYQPSSYMDDDPGHRGGLSQGQSSRSPGYYNGSSLSPSNGNTRPESWDYSWGRKQGRDRHTGGGGASAEYDWDRRSSSRVHDPYQASGRADYDQRRRHPDEYTQSSSRGRYYHESGDRRDYRDTRTGSHHNNSTPDLYTRLGYDKEDEEAERRQRERAQAGTSNKTSSPVPRYRPLPSDIAEQNRLNRQAAHSSMQAQISHEDIEHLRESLPPPPPPPRRAMGTMASTHARAMQQAHREKILSELPPPPPPEAPSGTPVSPSLPPQQQQQQQFTPPPPPPPPPVATAATATAVVAPPAPPVDSIPVSPYRNTAVSDASSTPPPPVHRIHNVSFGSHAPSPVAGTTTSSMTSATSPTQSSKGIGHNTTSTAGSSYPQTGRETQGTGGDDDDSSVSSVEDLDAPIWTDPDAGTRAARAKVAQAVGRATSAEGLSVVSSLDASLKGDACPLVTLQDIQDAVLRLEDFSPAELSKLSQDVRFLKLSIVSGMKHNYLLEGEARQLDHKIKLLIKNRINLQEVLRHSTAVADAKSDMIKRHTISESYEQYRGMLFFLQTRPVYLCRLVHAPRLRSTDVELLVSMIIFTLYGNQFAKREEVLLLSLLSMIIEQEVKRSPELGSFNRGNTIVTKLLSQYARRNVCITYLRGILQGPLQTLFDEKSSLELNPIKVYEQMHENMYGHLPEKERPPRAVSLAEAEKNTNVMSVIEPRRRTLLAHVLRFLEPILDSVHAIPYGMRFVSQQILAQARLHWPEARTYQTLTLVGGFVFLRVICPAIVSPGKFDIQIGDGSQVKGKGDGGATTSALALRNCVQVAKVLQNIANFRPFEEPHMSFFNDVVKNNQERMMYFFEELTRVDPPTDASEMRFSDLAEQGADVVVNVTGEEIYGMHSLLVQYEEVIAPSEGDDFHKALQALGSLPKGDKATLHLKQSIPLHLRNPEDLEQAIHRESDTEAFSTLKTALIETVRRIPKSQTFAKQSFVTSLENVKRAAADVEEFALAADVKKLQQLVSHAAKEEGCTTNDLAWRLMCTFEHDKGQLASLRAQHSSLTTVLQEVQGTRTRLDNQLACYHEYVRNVQGGQHPAHARAPGTKAVLMGPIAYTHTQLEKFNIISQSDLTPFMKKKASFQLACLSPGVFRWCVRLKEAVVYEKEIEENELLGLMHQVPPQLLKVGGVQCHPAPLMALLNKKFPPQDRKMAWNRLSTHTSL